MSEYQYVAFHAVDRPLDDKQLEFAERQSSRAEVSRWSFSVEYHYSSFRGDVNGLLRRGYDVHLLYTNYGDREIRLRLPGGLPFPKRQWADYVDGERLNWNKDARGSGGILSLRPFHESGELEQVWDFATYVDAAVQVREQLVEGDPRALYLLWLCASDDDYMDPAEVVQPAVPAGLAEMPDRCDSFLDFFGLDPLLLTAASEDGEPAPTQGDREQRFHDWAKGVSSDRARNLLSRLLTEDATVVKAELLAEMRDAQPAPTWPTTRSQRSLEALMLRAEELRSAENAKQALRAARKAKREAKEAKRQREARMEEMVKEPKRWLKEATKLADARGTDNYKAAAEILADLREAVGGDEGDKIARQHASYLAKKYPTLNHLKSSLRKRGLLG